MKFFRLFKAFKKVGIFSAMLFILLSLGGCASDYDKGKLSVVFINTGNSDSIFINFPDDRKMIIDGADADDKGKIQSVLRKYNTKKLEHVVITHQHSDHIGSFPALLGIYDFVHIYMPKSPIKSETFNEVVRVVNNKNKEFTRIKAGLILSNDEVYAEFLSPLHDTYKDENDYSGVLYLKYKNTSFLFMGDAGKPVENDLLKLGEKSSANGSQKILPVVDVLKIGHHGSKTATSKNFLNAVSPKYAVITTGKNSYGHPDKGVISLLNAMTIKTYRTDLEGNITFVSDGDSLVLKK